MEFKQVLKKRRSRYDLSNQSPIDTQALKSLLMDALNHTPSAYNAQGGRILCALNEHHNKIWDALLAIMKARQTPERWKKTKQKLNTFKAAHGTILFFNDMNVVKEYQNKYPRYADQTELWSNQSHGMLQYVVWASLADVGLGASLQHYNPIIDEAIKDIFEIPDSWQLTAQMPFGIPTNEPKEKHFKPIETRLKMFE